MHDRQTPTGQEQTSYLRALTQLCRLGAGDGDLAGLLRQVADLAVRANAARAASVILGDPADPVLLVSTSPLAQSADGAQYMSGTGPIFEAYRDAAVAGSVGGPSRPGTNPVGEIDSRAGAQLAMPLMIDDRPAGVFMLYGHDRQDPQITDRLAPFVVGAATLVRDNRAMTQLRLAEEQLREALSSRAVIDQAKGMIMVKRRCTADEAFEILVELSNATNRKLRELAAAFVDDSVKPGPLPDRSGRIARADRNDGLTGTTGRSG